MNYHNLSELCEYANDKISVSALSQKNYISTENMLPNRGGICEAESLPRTLKTSCFKKNDILISNIRPYFKKIWRAKINGGCSNDILVMRPQKNCDPKFLYYLLSSENFFSYATLTSKGTKMPRGDKNAIMNYQVPDFPYRIQKTIGEFLNTIDEKIQYNGRINDNLLEQVMLLYHKMFVESDNSDRFKCRAGEYFDISIGKTPPRKESQWFSKFPTEHVWVSISDMGSSGLFIGNSAEYLTSEAIQKFNIKVVPDGTVLLSFKLTVGRVAITDGAIATNEAIAHFKTDKPEITEYLYCYLKKFNYKMMGSTSSIATAVNSKIIKGMPFIVPSTEELDKFHRFTAPKFALIKNNVKANTRLANLRDLLLPKLMSGEIDVSAIQL